MQLRGGGAYRDESVSIVCYLVDQHAGGTISESQLLSFEEVLTRPIRPTGAVPTRGHPHL